jgi:small subunit ribosomal protein S20
LANTAQAKKRARQAEVHRQRNAGKRSAMRTSVKKAYKALGTGKKADAEVALKEASSMVDSMARKGMIHKNKAARHKSRLTKQIKALAG